MNKYHIVRVQLVRYSKTELSIKTIHLGGCDDLSICNACAENLNNLNLDSCTFCVIELDEVRKMGEGK